MYVFQYMYCIEMTSVLNTYVFQYNTCMYLKYISMQ